MKYCVKHLSVALISAISLSKAIYGVDNRRNYDDPGVTLQQRRAADATAAIVGAGLVVPGSPGYVNLVADQNSLCLSERFTYEPSVAHCSGFKVGNRLIATAAHCVLPHSCGSTRIVFGYYKTRAESSPHLNIPKAKVYSCRRIVGSVPVRNANLVPDWRVVEVDRNITAPQVTIRSSALPEISPGTALTVIGYPLGGPVKISSGAKVLGVFPSDTFLLNSDTYVGSSGSAIFNSATLSQGELFVEGILHGGNPDFIEHGDCDISRRYPEQGGGPSGGEFATSASEIERALVP